MNSAKRILICRTDSIGDVVLTLPVAGILKKYYPQCKLYFLGKNYTQSVIESCKYLDHFISWDELLSVDKKKRIQTLKMLKFDVVLHIFPQKEIVSLCKKALIPVRIGTTGRIYNWFGCNIRIPITRKRSDLHEAQLNLKLLKGLKINENLSLQEIPQYYGLEAPFCSSEFLQKYLHPDKYQIILHPRSKGSAREWGLNNFLELAKILSSQNVKILLCGTKEEGNLMLSECPELFEYVENLTGKLSLKEYMTLISQSYALVAASTGPLHLAAALGIHAVGIYPPIRPMHPGRWAALGKNSKIFVEDKECNKCKNEFFCICMGKINPKIVSLYLISQMHKIS